MVKTDKIVLATLFFLFGGSQVCLLPINKRRRFHKLSKIYNGNFPIPLIFASFQKTLFQRSIEQSCCFSQPGEGRRHYYCDVMTNEFCTRSFPMPSSKNIFERSGGGGGGGRSMEEKCCNFHISGDCGLGAVSLSAQG